MQKLLLVLLIINLHFSICSQSKKDLELQLDSLKMQIKKLESKSTQMDNELKNLQLNLTNITTTMSFVSKSNLDLESQVKNQQDFLKTLIAQNDSLLKIFMVSGGEKFVLSPKNESDSIIYVIQNYFLAKKWQDRLAYVLNPESVKSLMEFAYKDGFKSYKYEKDQINIPGSNYPLGKTFKAFVDGEPIYLKRTKDGFKYDWEASYGYNPIFTSAFLSEESTTPTVFRLTVKLQDFYREEYGINSKNYIAMYSSELGTVYMLQSAAFDLKKIILDGEKHQIIAEAYHKRLSDINGYGLEEKFIFFTRFIKDGWDK